jgi:hypothetical protein
MEATEMSDKSPFLTRPQPMFSITVDGRTYGFPKVLETADLEQVYQAFADILSVILESLPKGTLEGWDLRKKLARIHLELVPKPEPERDESNVISFPTGGRHAV